jgi:hypothetical protein
MMVSAYGDDERRRRAAELGRCRVHHQTGRFRAVEGAATPVACRSGLRERQFRPRAWALRLRVLWSTHPTIDGNSAISSKEGDPTDHPVSPAANRSPDR